MRPRILGISVARTALASIAFALLLAETFSPTRFAQKKLGATFGNVGARAKIDDNVLDSLPPIDKQALGSIDFLQYTTGSKTRTITQKTAIARNAIVSLIGWCGDPDLRATGSGAFLSIDGQTRIDVSQFLGSSRPDVVEYYASPLLMNSGFRIRIPASSIGAGTHEIQFGVIAKDRRGYFVLGGPIDLTILP